MTNDKFHISAVCYCIFLAVAQAMPGGSSNHHLETVPSLSDYSHIEYPHLDVIDLGETQQHVPEKEIKITRVIKITQPYPVKVPIKVPFPVPVVHQVPVEVTKVVKVPEHSHVDVVKSVQVHASVTNEHIPSSGLGHQEQWSSGNSNEHQEQEYVPQYQDNSQSHFNSDGHGDDTQNYAAIIAKQAMDYQDNFNQNQHGDDYQGNDNHNH